MKPVVNIPEVLLPCRGKINSFRRIGELEQQNQTIISLMVTLVDAFKHTFRPPWPIHLSIQRVKSGTIYCRWRKAGVNGQQPYLQFSSHMGQVFLAEQSERVCQVYRQFDRTALDLNLAHSLRMNEIRRLKKYIAHLKALSD